MAETEFTAVRITRETWNEIDRLKQKTRLSKAEIVRQAVEVLKDRTDLGAQVFQTQTTTEKTN